MRIANVRDVFMTYQVAESAKSTCTFHFRPFHIDDLERKLDGTLCRSWKGPCINAQLLFVITRH